MSTKILSLNDYKELYHQLDEAIIIFDEKHHIVSINQAFSKLTGFNEHDILGMPIETLNPIYNLLSKNILLTLQKTGKWNGEVPGKDSTDNKHFYLVNIKTVYTDNQKIKWHIACFLDVTQQKQTDGLIEHLANYDELTGLPNHYYFKKLLKDEITIANHHQQKFALFLLDIDKFKMINDTFGHEFGDKLLKEFTKRLQKNIRSTDIVSRRGGDEFNILIRDIKNFNFVKSFARSLLSIMSEEFNIKKNVILITISIGIVYFPKHSCNKNELLKKADEAMYLSKLKGRNTYTIL